MTAEKKPLVMNEEHGPPRFKARRVWQLSEDDFCEHPVVTDASRFMNGVIPPRMSREQLGAYGRLLRYARGQCVPENAAKGSLDGRVAILTGIAGSGKSTVVRWLRAAHPELFTVCATTGSASILIGGTTVDRIFAFRRGSSEDSDEPWEYSASRLDRSMKRETAPCIIVDEASMIGDRMAEVIDAVLSTYEKRVILVGDWAQAKPVKDDWPFARSLFRAAELIRLTECHRQDDPAYLSALNTVRAGEPIPEFFASREVAAPPDDGECIHAYATNKAADAHNRDRYMQLRGSLADPAAERRLHAVVSLCWFDNEGRLLRETPSRLPEHVNDKYKDGSALAHCLDVCPGARMLVVRNGYGLAYANGDTGTLEGFGDNPGAGVRVKLDRTGEAVSVVYAYDEIPDRALRTEFGWDREWEVSGRELDEACRRDRLPYHRAAHCVIGYPLRFGWAVTIHRTQGMTLPRIYVRLDTLRRIPQGSRHGMAYVALSRTERIDGLHLDNWDARVVERDDAVLGIV